MKEDLKTFRFNFHATIGEFILNAPNISSPLLATWKRSSQSVSTTTVQMAGGKAAFNQTITLPLNMYFDQSKGVFQDKKTLFTFNMSTPKGQKQAGVVYVEVAQILNNKLTSLSQNFVLEKCPVKESKVNITIVAELVGEGSISDTMSVDSSILMNQSGPSTLSIQSKKSIPVPIQSEPKLQNSSKSEIQQKNEVIQSLTKQVKELTLEKQKLQKQLQKSRKKDENSEASTLKEELLKSKTLQQKLQNEITNLRSQNVEHERELQKMRMRMQQIYELLFNNLNSLY